MVRLAALLPRTRSRSSGGAPDDVRSLDRAAAASPAVSTVPAGLVDLALDPPPRDGADGVGGAPPGVHPAWPEALQRRTATTSRDGWRRPVVRYLVVSLAVLLLVGVVTDVVLSSLARQRALDAAVNRIDRLAETVVRPLLHGTPVEDGAPAAASGAAPLTAALDAVVDARIVDGSLQGIIVWSSDGTVIYTRGDGLDDLVSDDLDALESGPVLRVEDVNDAVVDVAGVTALPGRGFARLAPGDHVHVVVLAGEGSSEEPLLVEMVVPGDEVLRVSDSLRVPMVAAALLALVVLGLAQLPLAVSLARRVYAAERSRRVLLTQAVASADLERRRLATQLHDDVIQDLAGLGYGLESLQRHGPEDQRAALGAARTLVQGDVAKLRGILTDLYPAELDSTCLVESLEQLAAPLRDEGVDVVVEAAGLDRLDRTRATLLHRVARECLANAHKHARARNVVVTVRDDAAGTLLQVRDDGRGFDPRADAEAARAGGHFGLTIVRDLVAEIGGSLELWSRPGDGTTVSLHLPPA